MILKTPYLTPDLDYSNDDILADLDEQSTKSLSGIRDVALLLQLVPDVDNFRSTLKVVKHWAKSKFIHSTPLGYPGGIAWAILVARTCQLYPNAAVSTLVQRVFEVFHSWGWPAPVMLRNLVRNSLGLQQFHPKVCATCLGPSAVT